MLGKMLIFDRRWKSEKVAKTEQNTYTRWEKDFDLAPLEFDLFDEYLEMSKFCLY